MLSSNEAASTGETEGVEIVAVKEGSPAWNAGLQKGDVIISVNRQPVSSLQDVGQALKGKHQGILLNIRRGDGALFITIE